MAASSLTDEDREWLAAQFNGLLTTDHREWLAQQFDGLTTERPTIKPSEWAELKRYLPPSVTSMPGYYRFDVAPYLREIVDCLSVDSPISEIAIQKGVQIGATVGVLENGIGYYIEHVKVAPCMLVTADSELVKLRMESYITPMLQQSELLHLIKSADETNARKTGKTDRKLEWVGGGFLVPIGAQNANKLRSISIQLLLNDEVDGWPDVVGKDGDPVALVRDRTAAFEGSRKILDISTPLIKGQSKIEKLFARGDQRRYFVRCLRCEHAQELRWSRTDNTTGVVTGIVWELDGGRLVPDSVRYLCEHCAHPHTDADKARLLSPSNGAEWRPTAVPVAPYVRSYHISALYSPHGMQSWATCVQKWLEAWDPETNRPRDLEKLQVFYNNVLGDTYELRGEKLRFEQISPHRRAAYAYGDIPNKWAAEHCGSTVLLLTTSVDVHKECLKVATWGWCRDRRVFLIDYDTLEGDTENLADAATWGALRELIEKREYKADDGRLYRIQLTLIDSGYRTDDVYQFCGEYGGGVFPVKGQAISPKSARVPEFSEFVTPNKIQAYGITVDLYKDRWSAALRRDWDGNGLQPYGHFNAPRDATDKQLKELTAEVKREKIDKRTGKRVGFEWYRAAGAANELWDMLVYGNAGLDLIARDYSVERLGLDHVNWQGFFDACEDGMYFTKS